MQQNKSDLNLGTSKILVADDDPSIRLLLKHILLAEGYSVIEASNGIEVIECCNENQFELIILDIVMPEMDGIEACRTINSQLTNAPPVLMITALEDEDSVDRSFSAGAVDLIRKPILWPVLRNRMRSHCFCTLIQRLRAACACL